jgi:hypothetical protein
MEATLGEGPVLLIGDAKSAGAKETAFSKSEVKLAKPFLESVIVTPLGSGNLKVTFEFYQEGTGRLKTVSCTGNPKDIEEEARKLLPARVQGLAGKAIILISYFAGQNLLSSTSQLSLQHP